MPARDISIVPTTTTAEKIILVDFAIDQIMIGGQTISINGRLMTRANLGELREYRTELVTREADDDSTSASGLALVQYGERQ